MNLETLEAFRSSSSFISASESAASNSYKWLDEMSSVAVFVCDMSTGQVLFVSKSTTNISGHDHQSFEKGGLSFFASLIHPNDYSGILNEFVKTILCFRKTQHTVSENYNFRSQFRIKHIDNYWLPVQTNILVLESTKTEGIKKVFGTLKPLTNSFHNDKLNDQRSIKIPQAMNPVHINLKKRPKEKITSRELEVLQLIAHGFSAKQIADKLFISVHTAINHRKNLIEKFKVKNTAELVLEASKVYWL